MTAIITASIWLLFVPDVAAGQLPCLQFRLTAAGQLPCLAVAPWVVAAGQLPILLLCSPGLWPMASYLLATVPFVATVRPFAFRSSVQLTPSSAHQAYLGRGGGGVGGVLGCSDKGVGSGTHLFVIGNYYPLWLTGAVGHRPLR